MEEDSARGGGMPRTTLIAASLGLLPACLDYGLGAQPGTDREPVEVEETFVQQSATPVDVLWVVDDTGSMAEEQEALAAAFSTFVDALDGAGIAYQLGVVAGDASAEEPGRLLGRPWIVTPDTPGGAEAFYQAVQVGTSGLGPEAGLYAAWLALTEPLRSGANRGFRRPGAALHVIAVSDADDESDGYLSQPVEDFLALLEDEAVGSGQPARFSAVAGEPPDGCEGSGGRAAPAERYAELVEATGGVFSSICSAELGPVLEALGEASQVFPDTFYLQAAAVPDSIAVWIDGERQLGGWSYQDDPPALVFDEPPPPDSSIRVTYDLAEEGP